MSKDEHSPSESEWQIMEVLWSNNTSFTSTEIKDVINQRNTMSLKMVRVLINRLLQKGLISYETDEHDSRVYHYRAAKSKEECVAEKSRKFVDSYFSGNQAGAFAALLQTYDLTDEQIAELQEILMKSKGKSSK